MLFVSNKLKKEAALVFKPGSYLIGQPGNCIETNPITTEIDLSAGREGFEPSAELNPSTHLAGEPNRPLWHLPNC
jgi:hypothetical protein